MAKRIGRPPRVAVELTNRIRKDWVDGRDLWFRLPPDERLVDEYGVNPKTIRAALDELIKAGKIIRKPFVGCFVVHARARWWHTHAGKNIAVYFSNPAGWMYERLSQNIIKGFIPLLVPINVNLVVSTQVFRWTKSVLAAKTNFKTPDVLGIILIGRPRADVFAAIQNVGKPLLALDFDAAEKGIDSFVFDNFSAGALLAGRLFKLGHRRVAAIFESFEKPIESCDEAWRARREGFLAKWKALGAPAPQIFELLERGNLPSVFPALREVLKKTKAERPTAVLLPSDSGVDIRALAADCRLQIPQDLTVVGFGDVGSNLPLKLQMTAVRFDGVELGNEALTHFLQRICDDKWGLRVAKKRCLSGIGARFFVS
jgi:hypothetical protein